MEFHIAREVRDELGLSEVLFRYTGNVVFADVSAARKLALRMTEARVAKLGDAAEPVNAGALYAMGLIDELSHALIAKYRRETDPAVLADGLRFLAGQTSAEDVDKLLRRFTEDFPNSDIYGGKLTVDQWLALDGEDETSSVPLPNREAAFEELLLLWLANTNPAFLPFRELFGDQRLREETVYKQTTASLPQYFGSRPPTEFGTLLEALQAPMKASPGSLAGQLDFIREKWAPTLGEHLRHVLLAVDTLREEEIAIWMRFHPPTADRFQHGEPKFEAHGFSGDEYIGFDEEWVTGSDGVRRRAYAADFQAPLNEYEAFSADDAWMPNVVLMAKSTYVWLEQLSKKYGRHIHRLDQIPGEELALLAQRGVTGLWLIGLWERSIASRTIKRLRGHADAVASAYSLKEYRIADDLGGEEAYMRLRDAAARHGLRLASDMVPNHMGIDSTWVIEHPDWFLSRPQPPFPAYSFNGPDLSADPRVEIKIDDYYFDQTDAAVAFKLHHFASGDTRFVYHGNDGTTFAWNDTAQLDYSKAAVREQVIQTILHVARQFPIIRFDAAMTLAKRHVQRLWFPLPGVGGSIPSRAEDAVTQEQFDALMPHEFWREVVDRVAEEVPGTLLLAEAFWMLEGYFVRTLGMHRVYNSAFMNMLRDEENAKYRSYLKKTIEFDPDILKRYVNFMSNPDERTTVDQFGSGDKCFGVATLMCTLPGLPMFGHGQIEGYTERYGMEYKQAKMDEWPNDALVQRHQKEIAPLLHRRWAFAESTHFALYDFWTGNGTVEENVFAYSNRSGDAPSLVVYNNSYGSAEGTLHRSAESMDKGSGQMRTRSVHDALGLSAAHDVVLAYRDHARELEYLLRAPDLAQNGFHLSLQGYQYAVLVDWRELRSSAEEPWDALCDALRGTGVRNLHDALKRLRMRPAHEALRQVMALSHATALGTGDSAAFVVAAEAFFAEAVKLLPLKSQTQLSSAVAEQAMYRETVKLAASALRTLPEAVAALKSEPASAVLPSNTSDQSERAWALPLAFAALDAHPDAANLFDELQLRDSLAEIFSDFGFAGEDAWRAAARVRLALRYGKTDIARTVSTQEFWDDSDVRWLAGVNESAGRTYFNREQFEELVASLALHALLSSDGKAVAATLQKMSLQAEEAGYEVAQMTTPAPLVQPPATPSRLVSPGAAPVVPAPAAPPPVKKSAGAPVKKTLAAPADGLIKKAGRSKAPQSAPDTPEAPAKPPVNIAATTAPRSPRSSPTLKSKKKDDPGPA